MLFPIIKVKDTATERVHIVGTNSHDVLEIDDAGNIRYRNLQNCEVSGNGQTYEFIPRPLEEFDVYYTIEFVTFDELIEIYKEQTKELCESERRIIDIAKRFFDDCIKENGLDQDEGIYNTVGNLI